MSNDTSPPPTPSTASNRRASFTPGQKLSELFGRSPPTTNGTSAYPGPIATAAANAQAQQRRRTSMSLGLSGSLGGSPTQTSGGFLRNRRGSFGSSSNSPGGSIEESAVEEGDAAPSSPPTSPFVRRMSFGARALRDARNGGTTGNVNGRASNSLASAPSVKGRGEGFDWSEQIKNRAERSASMTQRPSVTAPPPTPAENSRSVSMATAEPPARQMPAAREPRIPDHFQERILKGDFYMD